THARNVRRPRPLLREVLPVHEVVGGGSQAARNPRFRGAAPGSSLDGVLPHVRARGRVPRGAARNRPLHAGGIFRGHQGRPAVGGRGPAAGGPRAGSGTVKGAFFGAFDPSYPRNVVLQEGLEEAGATVTRVAVAPGTPAFVREAGLMARWAAAASSLDALLVPAFGHRDVPLAAALGRLSGSPVLFDPLVSRWDTQVGDLGRVAARSLSALRLRLSDRLALSLADLVLC